MKIKFHPASSNRPASSNQLTFTEPARYMRWSLASLRSFLDNRPDLRATLQGLVNRDLVGKVERLLPT